MIIFSLFATACILISTHEAAESQTLMTPSDKNNKFIYQVLGKISNKWTPHPESNLKFLSDQLIEQTESVLNCLDGPFSKKQKYHIALLIAAEYIKLYDFGLHIPMPSLRFCPYNTPTESLDILFSLSQPSQFVYHSNGRVLHRTSQHHSHLIHIQEGILSFLKPNLASILAPLRYILDRSMSIISTQTAPELVSFEDLEELTRRNVIPLSPHTVAHNSADILEQQYYSKELIVLELSSTALQQSKKHKPNYIPRKKRSHAKKRKSFSPPPTPVRNVQNLTSSFRSAPQGGQQAHPKGPPSHKNESSFASLLMQPIGRGGEQINMTESEKQFSYLLYRCSGKLSNKIYMQASCADYSFTPKSILSKLELGEKDRHTPSERARVFSFSLDGAISQGNAHDTLESEAIGMELDKSDSNSSIGSLLDLPQIMEVVNNSDSESDNYGFEIVDLGESTSSKSPVLSMDDGIEGRQRAMSMPKQYRRHRSQRVSLQIPPHLIYPKVYYPYGPKLNFNLRTILISRCRAFDFGENIFTDLLCFSYYNNESLSISGPYVRVLPQRTINNDATKNVGMREVREDSEKKSLEGRTEQELMKEIAEGATKSKSQLSDRRLFTGLSIFSHRAMTEFFGLFLCEDCPLSHDMLPQSLSILFPSFMWTIETLYEITNDIRLIEFVKPFLYFFFHHFHTVIGTDTSSVPIATPAPDALLSPPSALRSRINKNDYFIREVYDYLRYHEKSLIDSSYASSFSSLLPSPQLSTHSLSSSLHLNILRDKLTYKTLMQSLTSYTIKSKNIKSLYSKIVLHTQWYQWKKTPLKRMLLGQIHAFLKNSILNTDVLCSLERSNRQWMYTIFYLIAMSYREEKGLSILPQEVESSTIYCEHLYETRIYNQLSELNAIISPLFMLKAIFDLCNPSASFSTERGTDQSEEELREESQSIMRVKKEDIGDSIAFASKTYREVSEMLGTYQLSHLRKSVFNRLIPKRLIYFIKDESDYCGIKEISDMKEEDFIHRLYSDFQYREMYHQTLENSLVWNYYLKNIP